MIKTLKLNELQKLEELEEQEELEEREELEELEEVELGEINDISKWEDFIETKPFPSIHFEVLLLLVLLLLWQENVVKNMKIMKVEINTRGEHCCVYINLKIKNAKRIEPLEMPS